MRKPDEEGVRYVGPPVDAHGRVPKLKLEVGAAESLSVMLEEYAFFTPAVLYLHACMTDAPLIDCMWEMRRDVPIYHRKFDVPIFRGLHALDGDADWNHVLWAVGRDDWDFVHNFIASLTLSNTQSRTLIRVGGQDFTIADPLAADKKSADPPRLPVTAFGINGNKRMAGMVDGLRPSDPPVLRFFNPGEDMKVFADAYFGGANPLNARSNFVNRKKRGAEREG